MSRARRWTRFAPSVVLLLLAALAVFYLLVVERGAPSDAERASRAQSVLPVFRPDELCRIVLDRPGDRLVLERAETEWSMVSPRRSTADPAAIESLVGALGSASIVRHAAPDVGLGEERARIELTFAPPGPSGSRGRGGDETVERLELRGVASTPSGAAYVLREDGSRSGAVVVSADLVTELLLPSDRFRPRAVAPFPLARTERLLVDGGRGKAPILSLLRSGPATFHLGDGRRASRMATDALAIALDDLRAERFLPDDARASVVREATLQLTFSGKVGSDAADGGAEWSTLTIGAACPDHPEETSVARDGRSPWVGCVASPAIVALREALAGPDALLERHLFQARADEVSAVLLQTPTGTLDLARKGAGWTERAPVSRDLDPGEADAASSLLDDLLRAEGKPHALRPISPGSAVRRAILRYGDPATDEALAWTPSPAPSLAGDASEGGDGADLSFGPEARRLLEPGPQTLRSRTVWTPPIDAASVTSLRIGCPGFEQRLERSGGSWSLTAPVVAPADQAGVLDLLDAVVHLRAESWGSTSLTDSAAPSLALLADSRELASVTFGPIAQDGVAAEIRRAAEDGAAGGAASPRLDHEVVGRVCRWFVDRHAFALGADVSRVTFSRGGHPRAVDVAESNVRSVTVSREEAGTAQAAADEAEAIAALGSLVAVDVAHLGPPRASDVLDPVDVQIDWRSSAGRVTTLRFGPPLAGEIRRATVSGVPAVFVFREAQLAAFLRLFAASGTSGAAVRRP